MTVETLAWLETLSGASWSALHSREVQREDSTQIQSPV